MRDTWFLVAAALTAAAGTTLGEGVAHSQAALIAAGAALSAVFPWGLIAASLLYRRRRHARR